MQLLCCEWDYLFFNLQKEQLRWDSCLFISLIPGQSSTLLPTLPLQLVEKKGASAKQFLSFAAPIFWAYLLFFITSYYLTRFYFFQSVMGLANMEPDGCRGFLQDIAPSLIPLHSNLVQVCSSHSFSSALMYISAPSSWRYLFHFQKGDRFGAQQEGSYQILPSIQVTC